MDLPAGTVAAAGGAEPPFDGVDAKWIDPGLASRARAADERLYCWWSL